MSASKRPTRPPRWRSADRRREAIVRHVIEVDAGHLASVGWKAPAAAKPRERLAATRAAILAALEASASGEIPARGPRGGARWTARYFVGRVAWHAVAHAWEIERRAQPPSPDRHGLDATRS